MIYKKIDLSAIAFSNVSDDAAIGFIDWRIALKKPLTQRAFNLAVKEAVKCSALGLTPDEVLDKTQLWGWQAPNYAYTVSKLQSEIEATVKAYAQSYQQKLCDSTGKPKHTRDITIIENLNDRSWAE